MNSGQTRCYRLMGEALLPTHLRCCNPFFCCNIFLTFYVFIPKADDKKFPFVGKENDENRNGGMREERKGPIKDCTGTVKE